MKKCLFTGCGVAIVTPMNADGSVNYAMLDQLLEFQIAGGTDAIIICGTTGESATLTHEEHCAVIRHTVETVDHRIPVIAGSGSNDTSYAIALSQEAEKMGVDGLLVVTPYYNKTSQAGLVSHYTAIADQVNIPIIVYNVPSRTGCAFKPETYVQLAGHPNIVGIKEANGDISSVAKTLSLCGDQLAVYSGNDDQTLAMMALGGKGVISVLANICPKQMHDLTDKFFAGDLQGAQKLQLDLLDLMDAMFMDVNPIPVKEALNLMGYECGACRLPLVALSDENRKKLTAVMQKHGLLRV
ncbi:MAG TPA: 4-hydroxy-tetrahydrodipicolinate synthase [Candidatus Gallacutalibacter stercoravium]|nr:4-hydroxy-tetrahydrodipicolinate synthase [Candidatus Gallacutalibacter stercoravium]